MFLVNAMFDRLEDVAVDEAKVAAAKELIKQITPPSPLWTNGNTLKYHGL